MPWSGAACGSPTWPWAPAGSWRSATFTCPATPYGPELVRDGKPAAKVLKTERETRLPEIRPYLRPLSRQAARGVPTFLTGDFNSPSHLDWTPAVAAVRPQVKYPLRWPVSAALAGAGFRDSYREVYPDPVARPG